MKKIGLFLALYSIINTGFSQSWQQKDSIRNTDRTSGIAFTIGNKVYLGIGLNKSGNLRSDFWEFDPEDLSNGVDAFGIPKGKWTKKANFIGNGLWAAIGLSINGKGYVITGGDANSNSTKQCYEYDPVNNWWTKKQDFGGPARIYATGFTVNDKGYVGTGFNNGTSKTALNDIWEFDPSNTTNGLDSRGNPKGKWTQKVNFAGQPRAGAIAFTASEKGYLGTGEDAMGWLRDLWEYDPLDKSIGLDGNGNPLGKWTRKMDGPVARSFAVAFSIKDRGYVGTGEFGHLTFRNDFWEYDPLDKSNGLDANGNPKGKWNQKMNLKTVARRNAIGVSVNGKGYIGTGADDGYKIVKSGRDFWEYNPDTNSTIGIKPMAHEDRSMKIYPNPATDQLSIGINLTKSDDLTVSISSMNGNLIYAKEFSNLQSGENTVQLSLPSDHTQGIFFVTMEGADFKLFRKLILNP